MDASAVAPVARPAEPRSALSVPMVVGSAVLAGVGILGTLYWLVTSSWLYFASLAPMIVGAYLLFTRVTGPDHA